MAISHAGTTLVNHSRHDDIVADAEFELPLVQRQYPGLLGESHIVFPPLGRPLSCRCEFYGYASRDALETAVTALEALAGTLTGDITVTGPLARTIPDCTFLGLKLIDGAHLDGVDSTWYAEAFLFWQQKKRKVV